MSEAPDWAADIVPQAEDHPDRAEWAADIQPSAKPSPESPAHKAPHAAPTRFKQAGTPSPEPELSWGDTLHQAGQNFVPSAKGAGAAMWEAVRHPVQTLENLGNLGGGLISQGMGAVGVKQDPAQKAKTEALAKALEDHYATTYGSVKGFKKALATDPVGIGMDAATALDGVGGVAKVGGLSKTAAVLGKAASAVDPVANAVRVAKVAAKPVAGLARGASSAATGVPGSLLKVAQHAGATDQPELRAAFKKFYSGQGDPAEYIQAQQNALGKIRQSASDDYLAKKATLSTAQPDFKPIDDAISAARAETMKGGVNVGQFKKANDAIDQADAMVSGWKGQNSPDYRSLMGFDNLKQAIWDLRDEYPNDVAKRHLGAIYNGVKSAITDVDPEYAKLMEQYQTARNQITDLQKTLIGAGKNPSATTALAKGLRAFKTPTGKNLMQEMAEHEPTIPYMLAGEALHPWGAKGRAGLVEGFALPAAWATGTALHNPVAGAGQFAAQVLGQSPRIAGAVAYGAGKSADLAAQASPILRGGYYGERAGEDDTAAPTNLPDTAEGVWGRMIHQESRGHQFGADGSVTTSPKGAIGIAQIMPKTGPEAAKLAGEEWDPERLKTDPAYNEKLGRAYYGMLVDKFSDPILAAAAYNAGPGSVQQALVEAEKSGRPWVDFLPQETRNYVRAAGRGYASGGAVPAEIEPLVKRLMDMAKAAKRVEQKRTKPLLGASDDAVARALKLAGENI